MHDELAALPALAANAAADPRKTKSAVTKLAKALPAADLALFFEQACREFTAAGEPELATGFFTQARRVDAKHPALVDLNRLHRIFLEFTPLGVVAPTALRDHVKRMSAGLAPADAHARYREILDAAFAVRLVPYARIFPDARKLAKDAGIQRPVEEQDLADSLLRSGALCNASHAVWAAAQPYLARLARDDDKVKALLIEAAPDPAHEEDPELAEAIRIMWLTTLADAGAGTLLPVAWFFTIGRRCPVSVLIRLLDQAERSDDPPVFTGEGPDPFTDPLLARPAPSAKRTSSRRQAETDLARLAPGLNTPDKQERLDTLLGDFASELGYFANVDYPARLRSVCANDELRPLLREAAGRWSADLASGTLTRMAPALARLVPLAEAGYYELEPDLARPEPPDAAAALQATLRGGIPAELYFPPYERQRHWRSGTPVQHGDQLTFPSGNGWANVYTPEKRHDDLLIRATYQGHSLWYDDGGFRLSRARNGTWQTYRVEEGGADPLVTLDPETMSSRPDSPSEAEVVLPGASGPSRVSYENGVIVFTAPDGAVTARTPFPAVQTSTGKTFVPVYPPGWWTRMVPADFYGSQALRKLDHAGAAALLEAALAGPRTADEALRTVLPEVVEPPLREGVVEVARAAVEYLWKAVRLCVRLGAPAPAGLPAVLRTRPDLPVGRGLPTVFAIQSLSAVLEEAAAGPIGDAAEPACVAELPEGVRGAWFEFGHLGGRALKAARPWTTGYERPHLVDTLRAWANTPFGDGSGRWRVLYFTADGVSRPEEAPGQVWRTPSGAMAVLSYQGHPNKEAVVVEYAPDGAFAPGLLPGWRQRRAPVGQGWGGADRIAELIGLLAERGPVPADPGWVRRLADATGLSTLDAAEICFEYLYFAGTPTEVIDGYPHEVAAFFAALGGGRLKSKVPYWLQDDVRERLMPDDPADLWKDGPDIDRAAARYRELIKDGGGAP